MYHTVIDITNDSINVGNIAELEVNPLYIPKEITRSYE